jgi:hypothetical protein
MTIPELKLKGFDIFYMLPNHSDVACQRNRLIASGIEYAFEETTEEVAHCVLYVLAAKRLTPTFKAVLKQRSKTVRDFIREE